MERKVASELRTHVYIYTRERAQGTVVEKAGLELYV